MKMVKKVFNWFKNKNKIFLVHKEYYKFNKFKKTLNSP